MKIYLVCLIVILFLVFPMFFQSSLSAIQDGNPTLGIASSEDLKRKVSQGFTYNGKAVNVQEYFTKYKLQTTIVGQENIAKFKIFDYHGPDNIAHFDLAFGLDKGQTLQDSTIRIEWDRDEFGKEKTTLVDPNHVLDNVRVESGIEKCKTGGKVNCLVLTIYHTFREAPKFQIIATNIWNHQRLSWQNIFDPGLKIKGDSLNPLKQHTGIYEGKIYSLTETNKTKAVDEYGNFWSFDYGIWNKDYIAKPRPQDPTWNGMGRTNTQFPEMISNQTKVAQTTLKKVCPHCTDKNYEEIMNIKKMKIKGKLSKLQNPKLLKMMKLQNENATKSLEQMFHSMYPAKVFNEQSYKIQHGMTWIEKIRQSHK